jgi:transcriptional antiterminator RfaH
MPFWCCAQLENHRVGLALHCLQLEGYEIYAPRVLTHRLSHGRKIEGRPLLFPSYAFVLIITGWWQARWAPGVIRLITAGDATPVRVPSTVIAALRASERDGLVELPKTNRFRRGDKVRITRGPFREHLALYDGQTSHERVAVLLQLLGSQRLVELPEDAVEAVKPSLQLDTNRSLT